MRKGILLIMISLLSGLCYANGEDFYPVMTIDASLLKNATYVIRKDETTFEILNKGEAIKKHTWVITILNEAGDDRSGLVEFYDKIHVIESIEGSLYNAMGGLVKKLKSKEIEDRSGVDNNSLMTDYRIKLHNFNYSDYPYTVKYEVIEKYKSTLFYPVWMPQSANNLSIEQSSITIIAPTDYVFRHKAFNYAGKPIIQELGKKKSTTWEVKNLPVLTREYASPERYKIATSVYFGPTDFSIADYSGNMDSWKTFGKFVYDLTADRYTLPDDVKQQVHALTDHLKNDKDKIHVLYQYLQKNTRYISIQLGIGGWQPFDAKYVASKGYGDCKALTNYMFSLLKEAGIRSNYTLIRAGNSEPEIIADFPSQQFNHVILSVPGKQDTTWLECTSQIAPTGYLSDFTSDRYALSVNEEGGTLVRTPVYGTNENLQQRNLEASLDESGNLTIQANNNYLAIQQDRLHSVINYLTKEKIKEFLEEEFNFATYEINDFKYTEIKKSIPVIEEQLKISVSNYATITGKRLFMPVNVMSKTNRKLSKDSVRKYDIDLGFAYRDIDSVAFTLPAGFEAESIPKDNTIESKFGKYESKISVQGNKVFYYRLMEENGGKFPASDYPDLVKFYEEAYKADRQRLVMVRNEAPKKAF